MGGVQAKTVLLPSEHQRNVLNPSTFWNIEKTFASADMREKKAFWSFHVASISIWYDLTPPRLSFLARPEGERERERKAKSQGTISIGKHRLRTSAHVWTVQGGRREKYKRWGNAAYADFQFSPLLSLFLVRENLWELGGRGKRGQCGWEKICSRGTYGYDKIGEERERERARERVRNSDNCHALAER